MKIDLDTIPAYVIHNLERKDREESFKKEMELVFPGKAITVFPAIMLKEGKRGCFKSFQAVIKIAKENNFPYVLIMEDDVCFPKVIGIKEYIYQCFDNVPDEPWHVLMGGNYTGRPRNINNPHWKHLPDFSSSHFNIFNSSCYDKVLSYDTNVEIKKLQHFDRWFSADPNRNGGGMRAFMAFPVFALQRPSFSDITKGKTAYRMKFPTYQGEKKTLINEV